MKNQQPAFRVTATLEENNKSSSEVIMPMGLKPEDRLTLMPFTDKESSIGNPRNNQVIPEGCEPGALPWKHSEDINRKTAGIVGAIPIMTTPLAVICLLLNIVIPGTGTVLSGLTLLCRPVPSALAGGVGGSDERLALVCLNLWVGLAQLFTVTFLLIGWVWSITWGVIMLSLSSQRRSDQNSVPTQTEATAFSTSSKSGRFM
ncbi:protein SPEC3-like [Acipenser ruthenus]|uniref:protein SPEC3-like n=1 Tax=Acipenser ruthenus TaxID=7906 RepID=UPI0027422FCA|nr:protein SPEC3-like [Acipenser ruthenus]